MIETTSFGRRLRSTPLRISTAPKFFRSPRMSSSGRRGVCRGHWRAPRRRSIDFAEQVQGDIHHQIEDAGEDVELNGHEIAADHFLRLQQQFTDTDHREQAGALDQLDAGIDPGRQRSAERLRQQHIGEDLREGQADGTARLDLSGRDRLQRARATARRYGRRRTGRAPACRPAPPTATAPARRGCRRRRG